MARNTQKTAHREPMGGKHKAVDKSGGKHRGV